MTYVLGLIAAFAFGCVVAWGWCRAVADDGKSRGLPRETLTAQKKRAWK